MWDGVRQRPSTRDDEKKKSYPTIPNCTHHIATFSNPSRKGRWSGGREEVPSARATGRKPAAKAPEDEAASATESSTDETRTTPPAPGARGESRPCGKGKTEEEEEEVLGRVSSAGAPVTGQRYTRLSPTSRGWEDGPRAGSQVRTYLQRRSVNEVSMQMI